MLTGFFSMKSPSCKQVSLAVKLGKAEHKQGFSQAAKLKLWKQGRSLGYLSTTFLLPCCTPQTTEQFPFMPTHEASGSKIGCLQAPVA